MKSKITLSPEQMKELTIMGMDTSDASMCWVEDFVDNGYNIETRPRGSYMVKHNLVRRFQYAYTLEDIINKLPIYINGENGWKLNMSKYSIKYIDSSSRQCMKTCWGQPLIDNVFEMLKWVYENYPDEIKFLEDDMKEDKVLQAMEEYNETCSPEQKSKDLEILENECKSDVEMNESVRTTIPTPNTKDMITKDDIDSYNRVYNLLNSLSHTIWNFIYENVPIFLEWGKESDIYDFSVNNDKLCIQYINEHAQDDSDTAWLYVPMEHIYNDTWKDYLTNKICEFLDDEINTLEKKIKETHNRKDKLRIARNHLKQY